MALLADRLRVLRSSPFWGPRLGAAGVSAAGAAETPSLPPALPSIRSEELARDEAEHPPFGTWRVPVGGYVRAGWPVVPRALEAVFFTAEDLAREARVGAQALGSAGLEPGSRATNTFPGGLATPGSLIVGDAVQARGALDMPVGPLVTPQAGDVAFDFWSRVRPDFAVLDAGSVGELRALLERKGTTARGLGLRGAAVVTDLRDPEPDLTGLDVPVARIVGLPEAFSLLATRRPDGVYVPPPDEVLVEVAGGELLLTTLGHSAALLRYAPGVRAQAVEVEAAAGPGSRAVGFRLV